MAMNRAFLVDVLPSSSQDNANAWASAMVSVGNVVGFFMCVHAFDYAPNYPLTSPQSEQWQFETSHTSAMVWHHATSSHVVYYKRLFGWHSCPYCLARP